LIVTLADAVFVESATDLAVTLKLPVVEPAVNKPAVEIVPPVAVHVTEVFALPVTVAVNWRVCPGCSVALVGEIVTETTGTGLMVTLAEALFVVSATDFAVTLKLPAVEPAVNRSAVEIDPPVAVHVTAVLALPVTVAVNCCVCPTCSVALVGDIVTETTGVGLMVTLAEALFVESATDVAVTMKLPVVEPAVNRPAVEIVPPVAVQVTAVLELPVTAAVNCRVWVGCKVALVGESVT
jgi:hypothetical protein